MRIIRKMNIYLISNAAVINDYNKIVTTYSHSVCISSDSSHCVLLLKHNWFVTLCFSSQ
ncbi:hypothetical protein HanIR_Chr12g0599261 [Helianthus annuus]|nr:hypothetical protein HanIR_Chr12g0599261 [Helianthus annuus]